MGPEAQQEVNLINTALVSQCPSSPVLADSPVDSSTQLCSPASFQPYPTPAVDPQSAKANMRTLGSDSGGFKRAVPYKVGLKQS